MHGPFLIAKAPSDHSDRHNQLILTATQKPSLLRALCSKVLVFRLCGKWRIFHPQYTNNYFLKSNFCTDTLKVDSKFPLPILIQTLNLHFSSSHRSSRSLSLSLSVSFGRIVHVQWQTAQRQTKPDQAAVCCEMASVKHAFVEEDRHKQTHG